DGKNSLRRCGRSTAASGSSATCSDDAVKLTSKEKLMRRLASIVRVAAAGLIVTGTATVAHASHAQDAGMPNTPQASQDTQGGQTTAAQAVTAVLSVQKVDRSTRMLTLKA